LREIAKPVPLAARGGCWFEGPGTQIHLGSRRSLYPRAKHTRPCASQTWTYAGRCSRPQAYRLYRTQHYRMCVASTRWTLSETVSSSSRPATASHNT
jgi:hypothetical protein